MTVEQIWETLRKLDLFKGLERTIEVLESEPPTEIAVSSGGKYEARSSIVLFLSGRADIVKESETRTAYMKTLSEPTLFGFATLFSSEEYVSTLVAKTDVKLLLFDEAFVTALIKREPEFSLRLVKLLCQKVRYLNRRIDFYTCSDAEDKLHAFLKSSGDSEGNIVMSMSKLSEILGIGRASLYRAITSLEEKGYIIKEGKKIQLLKRIIL